MKFIDKPIFSTIELNTSMVKIGNEIEFTFMDRSPKSPNIDILGRGLITDILFRYDTAEESWLQPLHAYRL